MNENFISTIGIDPKILPNDIPIYTGHYHLPQTISKNIHYIGSPYQSKILNIISNLNMNDYSFKN